MDARHVRPRRLARGSRDVVTARVRSERPDLLHTHMVHARRVRLARPRTLLRIPFVSTRHNDDRYLLGPFRYVDRRLMRRRCGDRRDLGGRARASTIDAGLPAAKLQTIHYGLDELPSAPSEMTPGQAGIPTGGAAACWRSDA